MIQRIIKIAAIVTPLLVIGWDLAWWALGVSPMLPWTLKDALHENRGGFFLVDVRPPHKYGGSHIPGSKNLPGLASHPQLLNREHVDSPIVVICTSGRLSAIVGYKLRRQGFKKVYNLTAGMLGWRLVDGLTEGQE